MFFVCLPARAADCLISFGTECDHLTPDLQQMFKVMGSKVKVTYVLDHQWSRCGLFDFSQIWYRLWSRDIRCTTYVQGQCKRSLEVRAWKRHLIAKLLPSFRKSGELNFDKMLAISSLCACAVQSWPKKPRTTGATSGGIQVAMQTLSSFLPCDCEA